jgi:hypothetical protein
MAKLSLMLLHISKTLFWIIASPFLLLIGILCMIAAVILLVRLIFYFLVAREAPKRPKISRQEFRLRLKEALRNGS